MYGLTEIVIMNNFPMRLKGGVPSARSRTRPNVLRMSGRQAVKLAEFTETPIETMFDDPEQGFVNQPFTEGEWQARKAVR